MADEILEKYEEWHRNYNVNIVAQDELKLMIWHKTVLEHLLSLGIAGKKILDVGCGNGDLSNHLAVNHNSDVTGVDFSTESIKTANLKKEKFKALTSKFMVADAQALPFETASFDCVVSCECLEHVPDPQKMIDELYRVVKKDGIVILTTENYSNAYAYYIAFLKLIGKTFDSGSGAQPVEHFFVFWKVRKKFLKAGFAAVKTFSKQYVMLLVPGTAPSTFTIDEVKNGFMKTLLKPFGRRFTYIAQK
ncbi:MAG: class I SAM-dependent methyltransferase [Chitinophagaceae bacterium]|nr:class I SAM-dependent methyltransferase [Chitinophagaceae bacterium]